MTPAQRGGLVLTLTQPIAFGCQLLVTVLLARILTPEDFGLVVMVTAITNFALVFRDMGLGTITVQRPSLTDQQASNLFWSNSVIGVLLGLGVMALSRPISLFYGEPRLIPITLVTALLFLTSGLSVQHGALLRRELKFGSIAVVQLTSLSLSGAIAVFLAATTHSYWAIVSFPVLRSGLVLVVLWIVNPWRPSRPSLEAETPSLIKRGLRVAGFDVINYWSRNADNIVIGRVLGADILGIYQKGYELLLLPISQLRTPITEVALPILSQRQKNPPALASSYLDIVSALTLMSGATVGLALLVDDWLVPVILGEQWVDVVTVFSFLAPVAVLQSVVGTLGLLLISSDLTSRYFQWGVWHAALMVASFVIGIRWGLRGLMAAYVAANVLAFIPSIRFCVRGTAVSVKGFLGSFSPAALAITAFWAVGEGSKMAIKSAAQSDVIGAVVGAALFLALVVLHASYARRRYRLITETISRLWCSSA